MRTITLEEHFATPRFFEGPGRDLKEQAEKFNNARALKLIPQLCDLGDKRIAEMNAAGIEMQIVSLTAPGVEQLDAGRLGGTNRLRRDLARNIAAYPAFLPILLSLQEGLLFSLYLARFSRNQR
jgi:hypothetical protein